MSLDLLMARDHDFAFGRAMADAFARRPDRPTAYVCVNDEVAAGMVVAFRELGTKIPDDVSVLPFNNQDVCTHVLPASDDDRSAD
ncbi:MAG TPA: substrate-binding domain-containing protein [Opitutaceae bacterium]